MKAIRLYDATRDPQHWSAVISVGQFAVSHFDYKTGTWRNADGDYASSPEEELILLFDSFAEAESYCREQVARQPAIFCRIYDHRGSTEGMVSEIYSPEITRREFSPQVSRRRIRNGSLQLLAGVCCVVFDWWLGGSVILGVVVGSKFVTSGVIGLIRGFSGLAEVRE